jgi:DNA-binding CsgD family transcriptional regulator
MNYEQYREYAETIRQHEVLDALVEHQTQKAAATALGVSERNIRKAVKRMKDRAAIQGYAPEHDMTHTAPKSHIVKGVSTLYDEDGNVKSQWVKTDVAKEAQARLMSDMSEALVAELPQLEPSAYTGYADHNLMAIYPLGDPHIGMSALKEISGTDWDLEIAEKVFLNAFDRIVKTTPSCKRAVICNLGDYFHYDNVAGVTSRNGHHLDTDKDYLSMVDVGVKIMRRMIKSALEHHEHVEVITAIGNHDDVSSMFLMVALKHMYENEPRVVIHCKNDAFQYFRFGNNFFGVHHGHQAKADKLPLVMATDRATDWGDCANRYWLTGHIHHDSRKEYGGCTVESFRTLAAKDNYAYSGGWRAGQDTKALVVHIEYGEVERHTVNISQI